jgi:hypothetical protein
MLYVTRVVSTADKRHILSEGTLPQGFLNAYSPMILDGTVFSNRVLFQMLW